MGVTPIPVLRLFFPAGLREFMILAVLFRQESRPSLLFVVVPLMVILVISIVDAVLRCGSGQHGHRRCKRSGQAERSDIVMCTTQKRSSAAIPRNPYLQGNFPTQSVRDPPIKKPKRGLRRESSLVPEAAVSVVPVNLANANQWLAQYSRFLLGSLQ